MPRDDWSPLARMPAWKAPAPGTPARIQGMQRAPAGGIPAFASMSPLEGCAARPSTGGQIAGFNWYGRTAHSGPRRTPPADRRGMFGVVPIGIQPQAMPPTGLALDLIGRGALDQ